MKYDLGMRNCLKLPAGQGTTAVIRFFPMLKTSAKACGGSPGDPTPVSELPSGSPLLRAAGYPVPCQCAGITTSP